MFMGNNKNENGNTILVRWVKASVMVTKVH
jgi:hypothetical protein